MLLSPSPAKFTLTPRVQAFTLVELLVVMAVIIALIAIAGPALTSLKNNGDVNKAVYDISGIFEQSRAYALANNTYVYVGLAEVDASLSTSGTQKSGTGRLGIAGVATKVGTEGFSNTSLSASGSWSTIYSTFSRNLTVVGKPLVFENIHVPDLGAPPTTGNMVRPALDSSSSGMSYSLGNPQCVSATPFDYPVGSSLGAGQYSFTKVIQFDPQGIARIQSASDPAAITSYLEIGLQQTHGTSVTTLPTSPTTGNIAAIQIDGMTGAVRVYRP